MNLYQKHCVYFLWYQSVYMMHQSMKNEKSFLSREKKLLMQDLWIENFALIMTRNFWLRDTGFLVRKIAKNLKNGPTFLFMKTFFKHFFRYVVLLRKGAKSSRSSSKIKRQENAFFTEKWVGKSVQRFFLVQKLVCELWWSNFMKDDLRTLEFSKEEFHRLHPPSLVYHIWRIFDKFSVNFEGLCVNFRTFHDNFQAFLTIFQTFFRQLFTLFDHSFLQYVALDTIQAVNDQGIFCQIFLLLWPVFLLPKIALW